MRFFWMWCQEASQSDCKNTWNKTDKTRSPVLWSSITLESSRTVTSYWQCTPSWLKIHETITKLGWAYHTPNPLCTSDQALNDYHLFVPSKDTLHGTRFEDNECDSVHVLKKWLCLAGQNLVWVKITCTCFSVPIRLCKLMGVLWKKYIFPGHYLCKLGVALSWMASALCCSLGGLRFISQQGEIKKKLTLPSRTTHHKMGTRMILGKWKQLEWYWPKHPPKALWT